MTSHGPSVIVITGASSGIGLATAQAFARKKGKLVLVARNREALEKAAATCRALGGMVEICPADMSIEAQVELAAAIALRAFGRINVWINCAGILALGPFLELPPNHMTRVIEVNLFGCVHGSRAALRQFQLQGHRGTLINVSSMLGTFAEANMSAYCASKFAIRGFTSAIRQEMRSHRNIRICTALPVAIDTPIYQKAANFQGRRPRGIFPIYSTERAANTIVHLAQHPRAETIIGSYGRLLDMMNRLAPSLLERVLGIIGPRLQFEKQLAAHDSGNVFDTNGPFQVDGGWRAYWWKRLLTRDTKRD